MGKSLAMHFFVMLCLDACLRVLIADQRLVLPEHRVKRKYLAIKWLLCCFDGTHHHQFTIQSRPEKSRTALLLSSNQAITRKNRTIAWGKNRLPCADGRSKKPETLLLNCVVDGEAYASTPSMFPCLIRLITLTSPNDPMETTTTHRIRRIRDFRSAYWRTFSGVHTSGPGASRSVAVPTHAGFPPG